LLISAALLITNLFFLGKAACVLVSRWWYFMC